MRRLMHSVHMEATSLLLFPATKMFLQKTQLREFVLLSDGSSHVKVLCGRGGQQDFCRFMWQDTTADASSRAECKDFHTGSESHVAVAVECRTAAHLTAVNRAFLVLLLWIWEPCRHRCLTSCKSTSIWASLYYQWLTSLESVNHPREVGRG